MWKHFRRCLIVFALCVFPVHSLSASGVTVNINQEEVLAIPERTVQEMAAGGKLLLSDSPEEFMQTGILYSDVVEGNVRLFYHHVNGMLFDKKVAVVLENTQDKPVKVTVQRYGNAGPSADYLWVGKNAQQKYFAAKGTYNIELPAKGVALLDAKAAAQQIAPQELVNGIYDFNASGPVRVKVMAVGAFSNPLQEHDKAAVLPPDRHRLRGTFPYADRIKLTEKVFDGTSGDPHVITLGDGVIDKFITGIDATDGSTVLNFGNYGVFYKILMPRAAGSNVNVKVNPRGGVYAGALELQINGKSWAVIDTPGDRAFHENPDTATDVATIQPDNELWIHFMPPGASNLPIKLIFTPEDQKQAEKQ